MLEWNVNIGTEHPKWEMMDSTAEGAIPDISDIETELEWEHDLARFRVELGTAMYDECERWA